jgi:cold shock CspA family protein
LPHRKKIVGVFDYIRGVRAMPYGIVEWLNTKTGVGLIRTDDGENVSFLNNAIEESDTCSIREGARVRLDVMKSRYGLTAIHVRAIELPNETA